VGKTCEGRARSSAARKKPDSTPHVQRIKLGDMGKTKTWRRRTKKFKRESIPALGDQRDGKREKKRCEAKRRKIWEVHLYSPMAGAGGT